MHRVSTAYRYSSVLTMTDHWVGVVLIAPVRPETLAGACFVGGFMAAGFPEGLLVVDTVLAL
jgi:hypothetical protein